MGVGGSYRVMIRRMYRKEKEAGSLSLAMNLFGGSVSGARTSVGLR